MRRHITGRASWFALLLSCVFACSVPAQSPFDGAWKIDLSESQSSIKPDVYTLQNGIYSCPACDPPVTIPADGRDHRITQQPCYSTVSLRVLDSHTTLEIDKRAGRIVATTNLTVSPDGNTSTRKWTESCNGRGDTVSGTDILRRVAPGHPGSHAISGSWLLIKRLNRSENALVITLKLEGDSFSFIDPTGQGYTAKLDGSEARFKGAPSGTVVCVRRTDENTIEETDKHGGHVDQITRFVFSADHKTLTATIENKIDGSTHSFVLHRQ